jgi:hypothetical protein
VDERTQPKLKRRGSWLVVALVGVAVVVALFWLLLPIRLF